MDRAIHPCPSNPSASSAPSARALPRTERPEFTETYLSQTEIREVHPIRHIFSVLSVRRCEYAAGQQKMETNEVSGSIVDAAYRIHRDLGPGLLETVYEVVLADALKRKGLAVERQKPIPIRFDSRSFDEGFRADLVVEGRVLVELKSVERLARVHKKQILTYLKLSSFSVGLLINFGGELLKDNIERLVTARAPDLRNTISPGQSIR